MASVNDWLEGARIRTLPASLAPVIVGAAAAATTPNFSWVRTLLAAFVALAFQVGSNFANDYSDGVRGTDDFRQGPPRLTGGGKAKPQTVKLAAFACFALACVAGLALVAISGEWWLLVLGALAVLAAWFYTGGKHPYGYVGLGEIFVLVFFGYMATVGTTYTQTHATSLPLWLLATGIGLIACALLMVNNIRDIPSDREAGKKTLAVRLGERKARWSFYVLLAVPVLLATSMTIWGFYVFIGMLGLFGWVVALSRPVIQGETGKALIPVLRNTGLFELGYAVLVALGLVLTVHFPNAPWAVIGSVIACVGIVASLALEFLNLRRRPKARKVTKAAAVTPAQEPDQNFTVSSEAPDTARTGKHLA